MAAVGIAQTLGWQRFQHLKQCFFCFSWFFCLVFLCPFVSDFHDCYCCMSCLLCGTNATEGNGNNEEHSQDPKFY